MPLNALEVPLTFSMLVPKLLRSNITADGFLLQRLYTIVIDCVMLVSIVLWLLGLGGTGVNMIISVDYFKIFSFILKFIIFSLSLPITKLIAEYPPGILYISKALVFFEYALLEHFEGSRVMGIIIFTYILNQCNLVPVTKVATQQYTILFTLGSPQVLASTCRIPTIAGLRYYLCVQQSIG